MPDTASENYVTNAGWRAPAGRPDAIDEIADQFERPDAAGAVQFWTRDGAAELRWPQTPRAWDERPAWSIAS